ncbi:MFS transporter [Desulfovibrio sp. OttesenSCG-928-C14]|nr:MFS transporter [Desulfovibrio sp. OttesenSCG-928-C14]
MSSVTAGSGDFSNPASRENARECVMPAKGSYFDGAQITPRHKKIFLVIMLAYFFEQMDNINFGYVAQAMFDSWGLGAAAANQAMGLILTFYFIGMTLGGFLGGVISDLIGRRKTFLGSIILFSLCSVITGLPIDNLYLFITARALTGFGVFCMMVCSQVYIAEMAPAESRGKWQGLIGAIGFLALPVVGVLCTIVVPLSAESWRLIFYFGGLGLVGYALGSKYLCESPRWLVNQGRKSEAEAVIREVSGRQVDLSQEAARVECRSSVREILSGMFSGKYLGRTLLLLAAFLLVTPATFIFSTWTAKLLAGMSVIDPQSGAVSQAFSPRTALAIMTAITCGSPVGCFLASRIADLGGRKIPLCACFFAAGLGALMFAYAPASPILLFIAGFVISVSNMAGNMILFTYASESYPTKMRNTASGALNGMGRLSVSTFQAILPVLLLYFSQSGILNMDMRVIFTVCAILFVAPLLPVLILGQRTGGKSLEEIS